MNKYFCYKKLIIFSILFINSIYSYATDFTIDFTNSTTYESSIEGVRASLGDSVEPFNSLEGAESTLRQLRPDRSSGAHIIMISGLNQDDTVANIRLVLEPSNLYLAGFIYGNRYYRFSDMHGTHLPVDMEGRPSDSNTVTLTTNSSYGALVGVGGRGRSEITISRSLLSTSVSNLMRWASSNNRERPSLDSGAATAMIRYATVISEAVRFRGIARTFAARALGNSHGNFRLSARQIDFTVNWSSASNSIRNVVHPQDTIITQRNTVRTVKAISRIFGLLLFAKTSNSRNLGAVNSSIDRWTFQRGTFRTKSNHTYWDNRVFILAVLD